MSRYYELDRYKKLYNFLIGERPKPFKLVINKKEYNKFMELYKNDKEIKKLFDDEFSEIVIKED